MIEKVGKISNPLTIIAIFAALAEVLGTVPVGLVSPNVQETFIRFLIAFPILIVVSFFIVLYKKPQVLYAPSDFKNEEHFVEAMSLERVNLSLCKIQQQALDAKKEIKKMPNCNRYQKMQRSNLKTL